LAANGIKFTRENVVATGRDASGRVVFLETGNSSAGLNHIIARHNDDFAAVGIPEKRIADAVMQAATKGEVVGYQGVGTGRPIYEVVINGQRQYIAVTTSSNGFIVGANPRGAR
jgi:filamentous hemagglutinin